MSKYGEAAVNAVHYIQKMNLTPKEDWERATSEIFGKGSYRQKKGCPRGAFLGLCEEGLIKGVEPGKYTGSIKNKGYVLKNVELIQRDSSVMNDFNALWISVTNGSGISHNYQLDVVVSLCKGDLIHEISNGSIV